jgi:hypothetical protein
MGLDERIILRRILTKYDMEVGLDSSDIIIETSEGLL